MRKYKVTDLHTGATAEIKPKTEMKLIKGKFVETPNYDKYWNIAGWIIAIMAVISFINVIVQYSNLARG